MRINKTIEMEKDKTVRRRKLRWRKKENPEALTVLEGRTCHSKDI